MSVERAYLHGTSPSEQGRLSLLNRLMNEAAMRELAIRPGDSIVDFGCGLAQLSLQMAFATSSWEISRASGPSDTSCSISVTAT